MKKRALPLAAALLAAAVCAQAQLAPGAPGFNFGANPTSGFSMTGGSNSPVDDMAFKCNTPPWRQCTTEELNRQQSVKRAGRCPMTPASEACTNFLMRNAVGVTAPQGMDPLTMPDDFYKKCGTVPYRLCTPEEQRAQDAWKADQNDNRAPKNDEIVVTGSRYDQQPGFIGPPAPPDLSAGNITSVVESALQSNSFESAKREYGDRAVDLGGSGLGILSEDGKTVTVIGKDGRRDEAPVERYASQIEAARKSAGMFSGTSGGGTTSGNPPPSARQDPVPLNPRTGDGRTDAGDVIAAQGAMGRSNVSATGSGTGGNGATSDTPAPTGTIKVAGSTIESPDQIQTTFVGNQRVERLIEQSDNTMSSGKVEEFVTPDGRTNGEARGRLADVPLGPDGRPALTQADANSK